MKTMLWALALSTTLCAPTLAQDCLNAADLAGGISVKTQDGRIYAVRAAAAGKDGGVIVERFACPQNAPLPEPGKNWQRRVKLVRDQDGPSIGRQARIKARLQAEYEFLARKTVTISGCEYRILPIELTLRVTASTNATADGAPLDWLADAEGRAHLTRRLICFPDLGFSGITKEGSDMDAGGMALNGIIGLARAGG